MTLGGAGMAALPTSSELVLRYPVDSPPTTAAGAAVLMVLRDGSSGPEVLLIVRATHPDDPASGQVGLPGGHVDPSDHNLLATALREATEEIGLEPSMLEGSPRFVVVQSAPRFSLDVGVFVGRLGASERFVGRPDPDEVAELLWMPLSRLATVAERSVEDHGRQFQAAAVDLDGRTLWGFTLRVLREFVAATNAPSTA